MSFLAGLCGCFSRNDALPRSTPEMQNTNSQPCTRHGVPTGSFILSNEGNFVRAAGPGGRGGSRNGLRPPPDESEDGGYASVVPLPQYTPRPMSIHEKTLETNMRDPAMSSDSHGYGHGEKSRNLYDEEVTSDASSAISYPSSYGNTSTATRDTPPPPYSPRQSAVLSRSRSISVSSAVGITLNQPPMARVHGWQSGGPPSEADDRSIRRHRRVSWESR